ncbi:MAG: hypothetical protein J3R72DRAFT_456215, partial [Linnemannia gamsii]
MRSSIPTFTLLFAILSTITITSTTSAAPALSSSSSLSYSRFERRNIEATQKTCKDDCEKKVDKSYKVCMETKKEAQCG